MSSLEDIDENEMPLEKLNVADIIKESVEVLDYKLYEKKIITNVDVHDVYIESVHEDILRVFTNLIENGIKYNKDNGKIYISLRRVRNKAVIIIKDTGIGIKKEDLPHIFERFYRVDKSRNRKVEGTGLGLSIVKRIVMKYKGEISVKSTYNVGTEFTINFDAVTK